MLIHTRYTNSDGWTVDENTANLVPEFRTVLHDKKLGPKALAFIAIAKDPTSFLAEIYEDEDVRIKNAFDSVFDGKGELKELLKSKLVLAAMERYHELCDTAAMRLRNQYRESVQSASKFVHENREDITLTNFDKYVKSLKELPTFIQQFDEMGKQDDLDIENVKATIRGGRELTYRERKLQKSKKK